MLQEHGFVAEMIFVEHHICKAWSEEAVSFLDNFINEENDKSLLIMDYAKELHVSEALLRTAMKNLKLTGEYRTARNKALEDEVKRIVEEDRAAMAESHPLVKDKRLFRVSYWPDVTPSCFEDLDEDIS